MGQASISPQPSAINNAFLYGNDAANKWVVYNDVVLFRGQVLYLFIPFSTFIVSITFKTRNRRGVHPSFFRTSCNDNKVIHSFFKCNLPSLRDRDMSKDKKIRLFNEDQDV